MGKAIDLTGNKYGRLTVLSFSHMNRHSFWNCICDCGNKAKISSSSMKSGNTKSCGCLLKETITKHHLSKTPTYHIWAAMINRCTSDKNKHYKNYGGRGIKVCDRWLNFESFLEDMGESQKGLSIDRKNNDGDYCKENCKWATKEEQANNTRSNVKITYKGKTQTVAQWADEFNIARPTLYARISKYNMSIEDALNPKTYIKKRGLKGA